MVTIELDGNCFSLRQVKEFINADVNDYHTATYLYGTYGLDLLRNLYIAQNRRSAISITVLFESADLDNLLRHINIFSTFSFTLVPAKIEADIFRSMYEFFMYSPLSVTYITWMSSLILMPSRIIHNVSINGDLIQYPVCSGQKCFLANRNCSKGFIFHQLFHPAKGIPSNNDIESFCEIQRHYSELIAKDLSASSQGSIEIFRATRKSLGIERQYWVDPFNIYQGATL